MNPFRPLPGKHRVLRLPGRQEKGTARPGFPRGARLTLKTQRGFALIITLSLMVLLTLLSVGLLTLSTISLRGSGNVDAAARARANARMALTLAIGELQHRAGLDTRVTARADILDENNPPLLGVWKSWEGSDHDTQGRPISPGNYKSKKEQRFLSWMVSGAEPMSKAVPDVSERQGSVALVGPATVGKGPGLDKLQVHLEPVEIEDGRDMGGMAWWIGGENQKARLPKPYEPTDDTAPRWAVMAKSHAVANPEVFGMEDLMDKPEPALKVVSHQLSNFVGKADGDETVARKYFYDMSAVSVGLLTNTATGGWRKDLSLLTENWGTTSFPTSNLPLFRQTADKDLMYNRPTGTSPYPARSIFYPWSIYRGPSNMPIYCHGAVSTWENLKDYATLYKQITATSSGRNRIAAQSAAIDDSDAFTFIHKVRRLPVVARVQWVFSHFARPVTSPAGNVRAGLLLTPVVTMWNPYTVELSAPMLALTVNKPLPSALSYTINNVPETYKSVFGPSTNYTTPLTRTTETLRYEIQAPFTLMPGETRVFSPAANSIQDPVSGAALPLVAGYRGNKCGQFFPLKTPDFSADRTFSSGYKIKADAKFNTTYNDANALGVGIYMDMMVPKVGQSLGDAQRHLAYRMTYTPQMAQDVYGSLSGMVEATLSDCAASPVPFMSTIFGARMASNTHIPAKGFIQSSPLVNYTAMGGKDVVETTIARHYLGTGHPVNSPFDYSFKDHPEGGDSFLPNSSDSSQRGYIVTGFLKGDGLSRCPIAEIPVRPLQSICELQGWDLRYENPIPPYAFNLIGNSDATPLIPANAVVDSAFASLAENLQFDDSYCANHLLFDDWFFSSIAPDPSSYGSSGRAIPQVYADLVSGKQTLGNAAYRPIPQDMGVDKTTADTLYNNYVKGVNSWKNVASRLEVEGMFNVNSTSVAAWRALLGHARNQKVPYIRETGTSWSVDTSEELDHPFSRFSIAGDVEAGKGTSAGGFAGASEFTGYRKLDEDLIDQLATEIVHQVRERGPFLSLSEFINRQLSSGDLALAGAVQTALNKMAQGSNNPYSVIQGMSKDAVSVPSNSGAAEYRFPAAAAGESAYGLPGWTRQADVLRPLAPILSARDDTFTIRAHGDARDDKGKIIARAVCEAVVQRTRDYIDAKESADLATPSTSKLNKSFGRRFEIVSFRWLHASEI